MKTKEWIKQSNYAHKWVDEDASLGAEHRWLNKTVYKEEKLWNGNDITNVSLVGVGSLSYDNFLLLLDNEY